MGKLANTLHHLLVPSHRNNHRARSLHLDFLVGYLIFALVFSGGYMFLRKTGTGGRILGFASDVNIGSLNAIVNDYRAGNGLKALTINGRLSSAAGAKASNMFAENYWAHTSPSGKTPWSFIKRAGYAYRVAGENLAEGYDTSGAVVNAWMASATHRANIMRKDFTEVGYAILNGNLQGQDTTLVVQMFGARGKATAAKKSNATLASKGVRGVDIVDGQEGEEVYVENTDDETLLADSTQGVGAIATDMTQQELQKIGEVLGKSPLINMKKLSFNMTIAIFVGLLMLLMIDFVIATKAGLLRIGSKNLAHMIFISVVLGSLYLIGSGTIL